MHEKQGEETKNFHVRKYGRQKCTACRAGPLHSLSHLPFVGALTMEGDGGAVMLSIVHLRTPSIPFSCLATTLSSNKGERQEFIYILTVSSIRFSLLPHNVIFYNILSTTKELRASSFRPRTARDN